MEATVTPVKLAELGEPNSANLEQNAMTWLGQRVGRWFKEDNKWHWGNIIDVWIYTNEGPPQWSFLIEYEDTDQEDVGIDDLRIMVEQTKTRSAAEAMAQLRAQVLHVTFT